MFPDNKYSRWYNSIISQAQADVNRLVGRFEKHHIIPKSMGGPDTSSNLVKLTPREHLLCHLLLLKMTDGQNLFKMTCAMNLMMHNTNQKLGRTRVTTRKYDSARFYARVEFSEEHRHKISEAAKRRDPATRKQSAAANEKRRVFMQSYQKTAEHIENQAAATRGKTRKSWGHHSDEAKEKLSAVHLGKPKSEEAKKNMSLARLGKKYGPRGPYKKRINL